MHPSMQLIVRGGIRVTGNFKYQIEPEFCMKIDIMCEQEEEGFGDLYAAESLNGTCTKPGITVTYCPAVYGSWQDSYVDLYTYSQTRSLKLKWPVSLYTCVCIHNRAVRR